MDAYIMRQQIKRIQLKLDRLAKLDQNLEVFGADTHQYGLNSTISEVELLDFEHSNSITLPSEYREFLKQIGNGGAGPYYGLEPLKNGRFVDLNHKDENDLIDLSKPFLHTDHWNFSLEDQRPEKEEIYFDNQWINGLLRVSNFGCGVFINLVVNGSEHGNIWVDDRCNDQGIYPDPYFQTEDRISFLKWYELWLDKELRK